MRHLWILSLAACNDDTPTDTAAAGAPSYTTALSPVAVLTEPQGSVLHSHATAEWGDGDTFLMAFAAGSAPNVTPLAQVYTIDGAPESPILELAAVGDKPDVAWDGARWLIGWNDRSGRVLLGGIDPDGGVVAPSELYDTTIADLEADAVDLAVFEDGTGIAIWSEFCGFSNPDGCATFMGPDDGFIRWIGFDGALAPVGLAHEADNSSKKASDADDGPDSSWVGVWAREIEAGSGQILYEVWGRQYRADGTLWTFRADDMDSALPSRPAVAVRDDGVFAVVWRDKVQSEGADNGAGAYVRLFGPDAEPLGPSIRLDPGGDGDRVVVAWAGDLAVVSWQESEPQGRYGIELSAVHVPTGEIVVDRLVVNEPAGESDERPSIAIRTAGDAYEVLYTWEAMSPGGGQGLGIRSRVVTLTPAE
jgi:hypothetical protein